MTRFYKAIALLCAGLLIGAASAQTVAPKDIKTGAQSQVLTTTPNGAGTTASATFAPGTSGSVASCANLPPTVGLTIAGAGAAGGTYVGTVVSCVGTALVVNPATTTSVASGAAVQRVVASWGNPAAGGVISFNARTGAVVPATGDYNCSQITSAICSLPSLFNQTVDVDGVAQTQRAKLNFINGSAGTVSCVDNPVSGATDCTFTGGNSGTVTYSIADVTGSRTVNTAYQNTTSNPMFIQGSIGTSGSGTGNVAVAQGTTAFSLPFVGPANQATATVSGGDAGFTATVMPGYWYIVQTSGAVNGGVRHWTQITSTGTGGGGGGGGASLPTNAVVYGLSSSTSRAAVFGDIVNLWASGSCTTGYLKFDGTCSTPGGSYTPPTGTGFPHITSGTQDGAAVGETGTGSVVRAVSPALTGVPTVPTASIGTNTTQAASTAFVLANAGGCGSLAGDTTGPCTSNTTSKINNGSIPASTAFAGYDGSGKPIAAPYTPYQTPPITGSIATNVLADYNYLQQTGTVLTDISGANACSGSPCNGTLGSGANAPTWISNGLQFTYQQDQYVALPATINTAKTFVSYFYYYPVSLLPGTSPVTYNSSYSPLYSSSLGTAGINMINQSPTGDSPENFGQSGIWNSSLQTEAYNFSTGPHTYMHVLGTGAGNLDHIYIDGVESPLVVQGSTAGAQTSGNIDIGSSGVGPWSGQGGQMIMYRTRIYSDQKTAADAMALHQIFQADAQTRGVNTTVQPLNIGLPQFNSVGDSLSTNVNVTSPWATLLTLTNQPTYTVNVWGIGGVNLQALTASDPSRVARYCKTTVGGSSPTVVWAETNDFAQGATVAQAIQAMGGEVAVLKQAGCTVFVGTMIDRTTPNLATQKNAYNAALRTTYRSMGAVGIVDFAANPLLGADNASLSATYFGSGGGIHWNNTGQALGVLEANSAINYYYGSNAAAPTIITAATATLTADQGYVNVQPTANTTLTLPSCLGQTGAIYHINNQAAFSLTIKNAVSTQPINGTDYSSTGYVALNGAGTVTFTDVANPSAAAGCHWDTGAAPGSGGGNTTSTSLTTNKLPKANGANSIIDSSVSDDGTKVTVPEPLVINSAGNSIAMVEATAPSGVALSDFIYADSTAHRWKMNNNNGGAFAIPGVGTAGTSGNCVKFAANGIDLVDFGGVCSGSAGVSSFTGDGNFANNSASTGAVTLTLVNALAHKFWGNGTGSTAAPAYYLLGASDWSPYAYIAGAGSVNVMTATLSPAATALTAGLEVHVLPNLANTTSTPTLNVNGLGAATITKYGTTALAAGDYTTTAIADLIYDGTRWQLQNPQTIPASTSTVLHCAGRGTLSAAVYTNSSTNFYSCNSAGLTESANALTVGIASATSCTATINIIATTTGTGNVTLQFRKGTAGLTFTNYGASTTLPVGTTAGTFSYTASGGALIVGDAIDISITVGSVTFANSQIVSPTITCQ